MQKTLFIGLITTFFTLLFPLALAQETTPLASSSVSPQPVRYELPYPGLLPDNPLYIIKAIRDVLLRSLVTNPIKKVEFTILTSDKKLSMGLALLNKGKTDLAIQTIEESIADLKRAETQLFEIPATHSSQIPGIKDHFERSVVKHLEILTTLSESYPNITKFTFFLDTIKSLHSEYLRKK